jgi:hypothetical protein
VLYQLDQIIRTDVAIIGLWYMHCPRGFSCRWQTLFTRRCLARQNKPMSASPNTML